MNMKSLVHLIRVGLTAVILIGVATEVHAQNYPNKPIRFIVPVAPAGLTDILTRAIGQKLTESWGQPVIIDNRPGAGAIIGMEMAAKAPPDGYTILMSWPGPLAVNPSLYSKLPYDPVNDFVPVIQVATYPLILVVHPSLPVKSVKELIALAKSKPGEINYGSSGNATTSHLTMELFKTTADIDMVHIPYKGAAPAMTALLGGHVSLVFDSITVAMPHVKAGKLRVLGISSLKRSPAAPDLVTISESGLPGFEVIGWYGVLAPAGTPREIVTKLNNEIAKILQMPDLKERLSGQGLDLVSDTPEQFAAHIKKEIAKWAKVVKSAGIRVD